MAKLSEWKDEAVIIPLGRNCTKCFLFKPAKDFHIVKGKLHCRCKQCEKLRRNERNFQSNIEKYGEIEAIKRVELLAHKKTVQPGCKLCYRCRKEKSLDDFNQTTTTKDKKSSYCKSCASEMIKFYRQQSPGHRLAVSMNTAKQSARKKELPFELSTELLISLWEKQNGLCYYSGTEMIFDGSGKPESVSIDRIDSSSGYIPDNVVLCCAYINKMKSDQSIEIFTHWCSLIVNHQGNR